MTAEGTRCNWSVRLPAWHRLLLACLLLFLPLGHAATADLDAVFASQGVPMLWIDPSSGEIVAANAAASAFYGHDADVLATMSIDQINTLSPEQVAEERALAEKEGRNYFIFRHRLANDEIRTVEVYSHPYERNGTTLLLSVVHDITPGRNLDSGLWHYGERLEELVHEQTVDVVQRNRIIVMLLMAGLVLAGLAIFTLAYLLRQRQKAEAKSRRFKSIADTAMHGSLLTDLKGNVAYSNPFFANIHGYTPDELQGRHLSVFHSSAQMPAVERLLSQLKQQGFFTSTQVWHCNREGREFPMLMSGRVMRGCRGEPDYLATTAIDLTEHYLERKRTEDVLTRAREAAESASRAKSEFLANMSHEIRTPLNAIIGLSELQLRQSQSEPLREQALQIHRSGMLLLGIVNDLMDLSRLETSQLKLNSAPFRLDAVVSHIETLFANTCRDKGLGFAVNVQPDIPVGYQGDWPRLTQVLTNLVGNAVKFTEQGEVALQIEAADVQDERARLVFSVRDTGVGMTQEQQELLFQAFSQVDTSSTRVHGGAGLGLTISQQLVQLMGGDGVSLESTPNVGSCFSFELELPVVPNAQASGIGQTPGDSNAPRVGASDTQRDDIASALRGKRILVVEDNPVNQQVVESQLRQQGLQVELAGNGEEGVERVREGGLDLVLMDIQMPVMDGYDATRHIRGFNTDVPIVALTAAAPVEDRDKALEAGMNDHLGKPFSADDLLETIGRWLMPQEPARAKQGTVLIVDDVKDDIKILANLLKNDYIVKIAPRRDKALTIATSSSPPDLILLAPQEPCCVDSDVVYLALKNSQETCDIPIILIGPRDIDYGSLGESAQCFSGYIAKPFDAQNVTAVVGRHLKEST